MLTTRVTSYDTEITLLTLLGEDNLSMTAGGGRWCRGRDGWSKAAGQGNYGVRSAAGMIRASCCMDALVAACWMRQSDSHLIQEQKSHFAILVRAKCLICNHQRLIIQKHDQNSSFAKYRFIRVASPMTLLSQGFSYMCVPADLTATPLSITNSALTDQHSKPAVPE